MPLPNPRIEAALSASHGEPSPVLNKAIDADVREALSEQQQKRIESALNEVIKVFPHRQGIFSVLSPNSEEGSHTRYTVDLKYDTAKTCTCGDYMYRCDQKNGQVCKHIWRATFLQKLGALPPDEIDPYDWVLDELMVDKDYVEKFGEYTGDPQPPQQLDALISEVKETHRIAIDYTRICTERADILERVPFTSNSF